MIKILVIEDNHSNLAHINEILDLSEYEIHYSHNKSNGIEISGLYPQDVIIFYYECNDDLNLVRSLLKHDRIPVPVLIIAAHPSFEEQRLLMNLGVEDYIPENMIAASLPKCVKLRLERIARRTQSEKEKMTDFGDFSSASANTDHILVKIGTKLRLVKFSDIVCITAYKEYTKIKCLNTPEVLIRKSMRKWVKMLPKSFLRIHRSTIINMEFIEKINVAEGRHYQVSLQGITEPFDFSYRYTYLMRRTFPG